MRKVILTLLVAVAFMLNATAQDRVITGKVVDDKGVPVSGVSVTTGDGRGTQTDKNGNFVIRAVAPKSLTFSSINFETQVVPVTSDVVNLKFKASDTKLGEVVVTGYSVRRRTEFTGAASKVEAKKIEQVPFGSFDNILQGRVPGLYIASGSGQPGAAARVNVRGVGTIGGNTDPLYVLDGVPIESAVFRSLNPNDFESVDVLKDAASAGLYGSRGGNGVIVITSKKGRVGKTQIQYRGQYGFAQAPSAGNLQMMNTAQRLQYEEQFLGPSGVLGTGTATGYPGWDYSPTNPAYQLLPAATQTLYAGKLDSIRKIDTKWSDIFFRNGAFKEHELNASGGNENVRFYSSLSAYDQEGVLQRSNLERYTFRTNVDFRTDRLTASVHSYAGYSISKGIESEAGVALANPIAAAYLELPYRALYKSPGVLDIGTGKIGANAYDRALTTTSTSGQFKGNLSISAQYNIWNGIYVRTTNGVDYRNNNQSRFIDPNSYAGSLVTSGQQGSYQESFVENVQLINTTGVGYTKNISNKHQVNVQFLSESIHNKARTFNATGYGINKLLPNTPAAITPGNATNNEIPLIGGNKFNNGLSSLFATGDYTYNKKYTVSGTVRRDVTSQVAEKNKAVKTFSVGAVWNIMAEKFMSRQKIFQDARIRGSYGELPNVNALTSEFGYISTYGAGGSYNNVSGIVPTSPGNEDYALERQATTNIGFDVSLLKSRLRVSADFYKKESKDLFIAQGITRTSGFNSLNVNAGKMENRGIDFNISGDVVSANELTVTLGFNGGFLRNRITSLGQVSEIPQGTGIVRVGVPIGTHYQVGYLGVNPQTGLPVYEDINGNPTTEYLAANKRAAYGTYLPTFTGGATLDILWKGFSLNVFLTTAQNVNRYNNESFFYEATNANIAYNKRVEMLTSWRNPGDVTDYQKLNSARQFSSKDIRDASFVRLRNLQAGYTFTTKKGSPIRGFRIWGQGANIFTWTKWTGFDPEESNNIATYEFPNPKTYTLGLDINF